MSFCEPFFCGRIAGEALKHSAQDHAAACGLRAVAQGPLPLRWYTTFRHFQPWTSVMAGLYVLGHLRPAKAKPVAIQKHFAG